MKVTNTTSQQRGGDLKESDELQPHNQLLKFTVHVIGGFPSSPQAEWAEPELPAGGDGAVVGGLPAGGRGLPASQRRHAEGDQLCWEGGPRGGHAGG